MSGFGFQGSGNRRGRRSWLGFLLEGLVVLAVLVLLVDSDERPAGLFLTPDQLGQRRFERGEYEAAAEAFADPEWKAAARFRQGEFKEASGLYAGYDTAEGAYNQGNALAMQGLYEDAIPRFERALALQPGWEDAETNLAIARQQAERLKKEGGNMTGGEMGADDYIFTEGKPPNPEAEDETIDAEQAADDAAARAMWLRKVQTRPADFLKSKFAYEQATRGSK